MLYLFLNTETEYDEVTAATFSQVMQLSKSNKVLIPVVMQGKETDSVAAL